ncbi:MAG: CoA transferase [Dehalococcoidia bacterium]|jgi:crotonobetainyl-CoA:carnitine CoA-transferase CaiB-like acyl-CoA transferase|nr:CoA transferase [Dehalococcoidia bacterium]
MTNGDAVTDDAAARALDDVRVIDLSTSVAGTWCTRLLADFGADVIAVEPPGGSLLRSLAPFADDGTSVIASYVLANKRSIMLDVGHPQGRRALSAMVRESQIVVESGTPGTLDSWGIGLDQRDARWPKQILVSVTPHGQDGGREHLPGNDLTAYAYSGWASVNGLADREPLKGSGYTGSYLAGVAAYAGAVTALCYADQHEGEGQHVDVAESEAAGIVFAPALLATLYAGAVAGRKPGMDLMTGPVPVRDGHFALTLSRAHFWRDAMTVLGLDELSADRRFDSGWYHREHRDEFMPLVQERMAQRDKMELFDALGTMRVVAGPVLDTAELSENEHLRARAAFVRPSEDPEGLEYPGAPFVMSETPWALDRRAPRAGENAVRVLRDAADYTDDWIGGLAEQGVLG